MKKNVILSLCVFASLMAILIGIGACNVSTDVPSGQRTTPTTHSNPSKNGPGADEAVVSKGEPILRTQINGDDIVHVGEDVPAGTYRMVTAVSGGMCYWNKSKDAEGADIINNGTPSGGRSQVVLKKGQWFTSQGCPDWAKK